MTKTKTDHCTTQTLSKNTVKSKWPMIVEIFFLLSDFNGTQQQIMCILKKNHQKIELTFRRKKWY